MGLQHEICLLTVFPWSHDGPSDGVYTTFINDSHSEATLGNNGPRGIRLSGLCLHDCHEDVAICWELHIYYLLIVRTEDLLGAPKLMQV